jgi:lipid A 3-O-deacylase
MAAMGVSMGLNLLLGQIGAVCALMLCAWLGQLCSGMSPAWAEAGRISLIEENDGLLPDHWDRHYTQGAMLAYLSPNVMPEDFAAHLFEGVAGALPILQPGAGVARKFDVVVGQSIFTPVRYHDPIPDPADRPFAGWLYTGGSLMQETGGTMLENLELLVGVVGPASLARQAQEAFHSAAGFNNKNLDQAWSHQLRNEPGIMLTYERKWRVWRTSVAGLEADLIPEAGITAGNVMTYAEAGALVRFGHNLNVDYGQARIRPSLSGTPWFDATRLEGPFGWYLFAGVQGRAVARNIFLDGNTVARSPSVQKEILVGDLTAGASLFWADWAKLDFSFTQRTKEFVTQKQMDHFAGANLSFGF